MMVNGVRLVPDPSGALWWPSERTLVVADLHLEKAASFAARRVLLPPYDTRSTLARLKVLIRRYTPRRVVCLGDSFHSTQGPRSLHEADREVLARMTTECEWLWLFGNHDPSLPDGFPGEVSDRLVLSGLTLQHAPDGPRGAGEVFGHFHPKATVVVRGRTLTRRCFLTDGRRLVLPAFGAFAGGLDALDGAFAGVFQGVYTGWLLGERQVFPVSLFDSARKARASGHS